MRAQVLAAVAGTPVLAAEELALEGGEERPDRVGGEGALPAVGDGHGGRGGVLGANGHACRAAPVRYGSLKGNRGDLNGLMYYAISMKSSDLQQKEHGFRYE